jgi:hypothetical protein
VRDPLAISELQPGPNLTIEPLAPGPDVVAGLPSAIDLAMAPPPEAPPAAEEKEAKPPSMLRFGIVLPPEMLEAQAFVSPPEPAAPDLPPLPAAAPVAPAVAPDAAAAVPPAAAAPVTAFVEPRPGPLNISAAPTVLGFAVSLTQTEAPPTVIGHQAAQPPPTEPEDPKGRPGSS